MRIFLTFVISLFALSCLQAQNPYKEFGIEVEPLTLSKGKYNEFFTNDSLVRIGSVILDTRNNRIASFVVVDTAYSEATLEPEVSSRFLSPDPYAADYPDLSPYTYVANNPIRYFDPTGMWIAEYDEEGNIVNVRAEEGDDLAGLYDQLDISAERFAKEYRIDDMGGFEVVGGETTFDITSFALKNTDFSGAANGQNCHGFVCQAKGIETGPLGQVQGNELLSKLGDPVQTNDPKTGDIGVFEAEGSMDGVNLTGHPAHSAIFLLRNQSGEAQFLNRLNTGKPVVVSTTSQIRSYFQGVNKQANALGVTFPRFIPIPKFYKAKK